MESVIAILNAFFPDQTVKHGPFQGLKFLNFDNYHHNLFPKLLGSFEMELQRVIQQIIKNKYDTIINIGCAEGYYTIGLALKIKSASVMAFDTDPLAQTLCNEMAKLNNVQDRVNVLGECKISDLVSLSLKNTLILCDCEGYEKELFNASTAHYFKNCDLLVETHDCFDAAISHQIKHAFSKSHVVQSIKSISDQQKAETYQFEEINQLKLSAKEMLLAERRSGIMEWLFIKSQ